jgi:hypothetical protein
LKAQMDRNGKVSGRRCTAVRADGTPCRAWAVRGSDEPLCAAHGGTSARIGAPPGNRNALKHGFYVRRECEERLQDVSPDEWSIETVILDLCIKQAQLSRYIEVNSGDLSADELARFLQIHGQNASRLGRLLRDRRALCGDTDPLSNAIAQALEELSEELGTDLT